MLTPETFLCSPSPDCRCASFSSHVSWISGARPFGFRSSMDVIRWQRYQSNLKMNKRLTIYYKAVIVFFSLPIYAFLWEKTNGDNFRDFIFLFFSSTILNAKGLILHSYCYLSVPFFQNYIFFFLHGRIKGTATGNREGNTRSKHPAKEAASWGWKQSQS